MKTIVILLDGVGDRVSDKLGRKTPLEYAHTPNMDRIAALGETGMMTPYRLGVPVGTDFAHFLLFGYPEEHYPGRSIIEGLSRQAPIQKERLYMVTSWASVKKDPDYAIKNRYLTELTKEESLELATLIPKTWDGCGIQWHYTSDAHGLLEITGDHLTTEISDPDGIYPLGYVLRSEPYGTKNPNAIATSDLINSLMIEMHTLLKEHPINRKREKQGQEPANFLLPKWAGRLGDLLSFQEENGMRGEIIGSSDMIRGVANLLEMKYTPYETYAAGVKMAIASSSEYVHLHTKETDQASHMKDPVAKARVLEELDALLSPIVEYALEGDILLIITGDHTTPSSGPSIHSGEPVPIAFLGKNLRTDDVECFDERSCGKGSIRMMGKDLMPMILNYHDKSLFHNFRVGGRKSKYLPTTLNKL